MFFPPFFPRSNFPSYKKGITTAWNTEELQKVLTIYLFIFQTDVDLFLSHRSIVECNLFTFKKVCVQIK